MSDVNLELLNLRAKVHDLESVLIAAHPRMPSLLRDIHTQLRKDPEIVTLMSEEEIGILVRGLMLQTNTVIATSVVKAPSVAKQIKAAKSAGTFSEDFF